MKGTRITLNGKEYEVRPTLGAIEDYADEIGVGEGWQNTLSHPKNLRLFLYHCVKKHGVTADELRDLEMSQLTQALNGMGGTDEKK